MGAGSGQESRAAAETDPPASLQPVPGVSGATVYVRPGADFSATGSLQIEQPAVRFADGWLERQNRSRVQRLRQAEVTSMEHEYTLLLGEVFSEELARQGTDLLPSGELQAARDAAPPGGDSYLVLRPAVTDLELNAPAPVGSGRSEHFAASTGSARITLDLIDPATGELIARVVDRQAIDPADGSLRRTDRSTQRAALARLFRSWAHMLSAELEALRAADS
jgi:hypothetical protein